METRKPKARPPWLYPNIHSSSKNRCSEYEIPSRIYGCASIAAYSFGSSVMGHRGQKDAVARALSGTVLSVSAAPNKSHVIFFVLILILINSWTGNPYIAGKLICFLGSYRLSRDWERKYGMHLCRSKRSALWREALVTSTRV